VKVEKVRTTRQLGKVRRVGRHMGRRPDWKKAYVTLAEGSRIDFFEGA
jgi:large subunit ribosomal protein L23